MITVEELFERFINAADRGSSENLRLLDADVAANLEQLSSVLAPAFDDESLARLQAAGFIDELMKNEARAARRQWLEIEPDQRNSAAAKASDGLRRVFQHCDVILIRAGQRIDEIESAR
jgi:hypothetical protein